MDPLTIARGGMTAASNRLNASAERTVRAPEDPKVDLGHEVVEQISAKQAFRADANVVRVADQMLSSLLEIQDVRGGKK